MALHFRLLGEYVAAIDAQPLHLRTDKIRGLLAYLSLSGKKQHRRDSLATLFWPEFDDDGARGNLRTSLSRLRQSIRAVDEGLDSRLFAGSREYLSFGSSGDDDLLLCDAVRFRGLLAVCDTHTHADLLGCPACLERMRSAAELYRGDLLAELDLPDSAPFNEWLIVERESLHQQALVLLDLLAEQAHQQADYPALAAYARRSLALEVWQEKSHRRLMLALAAQGQWAAALRQYAQCCEVLERELGVGVTAETAEVYQAILTQRLSPAREDAAAHSAFRIPHSAFRTPPRPSRQPGRCAGGRVVCGPQREIGAIGPLDRR